MIRGALALVCAASMAAGCALELDYDPPTQSVHEAGRADGGGLDVGPRDGGVPVTCDAGCDDGLRCTADNCSGGHCMHTDLCTTGTDCVARNGGECRRPCTSAADCNDGNPCTTDSCDPADMHCAHASNCPATRPVCIDGGVCVPDHCTTDAECSDGDACNGIEHCISSACHGGAPVTCAPSIGCETIACDPTTGGCVAHLDAGMCDDGRACTVDACTAGGQCTHLPNDAACATADHCVTRACRPEMTIDWTGCVQVSAVGCSASPCMGPMPAQCDPTTGACNFDALCAPGQVCTPMGCHASMCTTDLGCAGIHTSTGCATFCTGGACLPRMCMPPPPGSCAMLSVDASGCPINGACTYVPNDGLCADGDPLSVDSCDPRTFSCSHTCPSTTSSCETFAYNGTMCAPTLDPSFCSATHPAPTHNDCAAWVCVGAVGGGGPDGCAAVPSNAACDDGALCTDDVCTLGSNAMGSCTNPQSPNAATICDDGLACSRDACDPGASMSPSGCTHTPDDNLCQAGVPLQCATATCAMIPASARIGPLPTGCALQYDDTHCTTGTVCTTDGLCRQVTCSAGVTCDDGNPCNGLETCGAGNVCTQSPPMMASICATVGMCTGVCTPMGCVTPQLPSCGATVGP
jgi:hypothetical protein